jgi:hypothetical protein
LDKTEHFSKVSIPLHSVSFAHLASLVHFMLEELLSLLGLLLPPLFSFFPGVVVSGQFPEPVQFFYVLPNNPLLSCNM